MYNILESNEKISNIVFKQLRESFNDLELDNEMDFEDYTESGKSSQYLYIKWRNENRNTITIQDDTM